MSDNPTSEKKPAPPVTMEMAVVQCEGFRCLAYRDGEKWRDFQTGEVLAAVKEVIHIFPV